MDTHQRETRDPSGAPAPRVDMYVGVHKALRALMADTLLAVGRMDTDDAFELAEVTQRVMQLLDFCSAHLRHEADFVHPAIEARAPGETTGTAKDHAVHEKQISALAAQATALLNVAPEARAADALTLYRALSLFIAHNLEHMVVEETSNNAALWKHYSDAELKDIHGALLATVQPDEMMFYMRWLGPYMNPAERAALLADMRIHAPPPAFDAAIDTIRPHLTEREWTKLIERLGTA